MTTHESFKPSDTDIIPDQIIQWEGCPNNEKRIKQLAWPHHQRAHQVIRVFAIKSLHFIISVQQDHAPMTIEGLVYAIALVPQIHTLFCFALLIRNTKHSFCCFAAYLQ
jgi:hypothetical protein